MRAPDEIRAFFEQCFADHGESALGVGWNGRPAQEIRFDQLLKVIQPDKPFTLTEFGCGYGHLIDYMRSNAITPQVYRGVDIALNSLEAARKRFAGNPAIAFYNDPDLVPQSDYLVASGVFNVKLSADKVEWTRYILENLNRFHSMTTAGFAVNFLTIYSDHERMAERPDLYYADPCFLFDYCKTNFSRNVAILHDYQLYDFTLIVRKN